MIGSEETPLQTTERITIGVCDTFVFALLAVNPREVRFTELPNSHCRIVLELQNDANCSRELRFLIQTSARIPRPLGRGGARKLR